MRQDSICARLIHEKQERAYAAGKEDSADEQQHEANDHAAEDNQQYPG